ncbi:MAG: CopD family protein [Pseudomonadota bacterium]
MLSPLFNALHALAATLWVGGMFFAYVVLRPAVGFMEPPQRLTMWNNVFARFFRWVWVIVIALPATGYYAVYADFGGFAQSGVHVLFMHVLGWIMIALFLFMFVGPYRRYRAAVETQDWPTAGRILVVIRRIVAMNMALGLVTIAIGASGRLW